MSKETLYFILYALDRYNINKIKKSFGLKEDTQALVFAIQITADNIPTIKKIMKKKGVEYWN